MGHHHRTPTPIALVPYNPKGTAPWVDPDNLLRVAAALNIQAIRDLAPFWNVRAIVSPFLDLDRVPSGYDMIVVLPEECEFTGPRGFHFLEGGTSLAVVQYAPDWSLGASHELMEMLCDRAGDHTTTGPSLVDDQGDDQGRVTYLVEVCDPCQHSTYTIDGVLVSDFVTPEWYSGPPDHRGLYSLTGRVTSPRQLLEGGYVTWSTRPPEQEVWQALAPHGAGPQPLPVKTTALDMKPMTLARLARDWVDLHPPKPPATRDSASGTVFGDEPLGAAATAFVQAELEARRNGEQMRHVIKEVLDAANTPVATPKITALLALLKTPKGQKEFRANPSRYLKGLAPRGHAVPLPILDPTVLPVLDRYNEALSAFQSPDRFGVDFCKIDLQGLYMWMCQLGGF